MMHNYFHYYLLFLSLWNIVQFSSSKRCAHNHHDPQSYGAIHLGQQQHSSSFITPALSSQYSYSLITDNDVDEGKRIHQQQQFTESPSNDHVIVVDPTTITTTTTTPKQKRSQSTTPTDQQQQQQQHFPTQSHHNNFPSIENLLANQNFTTLLESSEYLQNSPLFSNYFLPTSTGSLYPVDLNSILPPSSNQQYGQYYYQTRPYKNKNKTISLGRRIGELVSNSAERATRAFKSFPKLLNDIKPSKLLGLSPAEPDLTPKHNISSIPLPSSWYLPQNTWSSFAPPPITSSVYLQQPVFVRTQDISSSTSIHSSSPLQTNQILSPSSTPTIKNSVEFSNVALNRFANGQQNVYPNDLYTSAQTSYGNRVKPPREQYSEFDSSNEELSPNDQDDTKMANEGHVDYSEENRMNNNNNNNSGLIQNENLNSNLISNENNGWQHSGTQPYEDYIESGSTDFYNHQTNYNPNAVRFPKNSPNHIRRPFPPNFHPSVYNRRPYSISEIDEVDNWYPSFFGPNVKPITRLRNVPFNSPSFNSFSPSNSLLNSAASTPSVSSEYIPFMPLRQPEPLTSSFYPIAAAPVGPRPSWSFGYYPNYNPANQYFNYRPNSMMAAAGSMIRPITIPFFPPINNFYMQRYRSLPYVGSYGYQTPINPILNSQPYRFQSPFNSLVTAASSLYPVRVPFPPISPPLSYNTIVPAPITHIPILRHRIGSLTPQKIQQTKVPIWRRNEITGKHVNKPKLKVPEVKHNNSTNKYNDDNEMAALYNTYQMFQKQFNTNQNGDMDHLSASHYYLNPHEYHYHYVNTTESSSSPLMIVTSTIQPTENLLLSSSNQTSFRSMRAYRHIDRRDHNIANSGKEFLLKSSIIDSNKKKDAEQNKNIDGPKHHHLPAMINDTITNEWKPIFKSLIRKIH